MSTCLGCLAETDIGDVPTLPMLLRGQFCPVCAMRLGFVPPVEIIYGAADDADDADEMDDDFDVDEDDDSSSDAGE